MLRNLALALGSLVVVFGGLEGGLRLAGYGGLEVYDPDPVLFWRLRPGQTCRTKVGGEPVHVNTLGYRGAEISPRKPAETLRVFVFGDSATFGWGVGDDDTYAAQLGRRLLAGGMPVEVVNAGVNAYSLFQEAEAFRRALPLGPDVAVFAFAFNESWQDLQWLDAAGRKRVQRAVEWKNRLRRSAIFHAFGEIRFRVLYDRLRERLTTDVHGGPPRPDAERLARYRATLSEIGERARAADVDLVFLVLPTRGRSEPDPFQAAMADFAETHGIGLVDLSRGVDEPDRWFLPEDTVHPSVEGHADLARRLEPLVLAHLKRRRAVRRAAA